MLGKNQDFAPMEQLGAEQLFGISPGKEKQLSALPKLDADVLAAKFPCFDLRAEVSAFSEHSNGVGYLNSPLSPI